MTAQKKATALVSVIALGAALGAAPLFAAGHTIAMTSSVTASNTDYLALAVEAPQAAKDFLIAHGANPATISDPLAEMNVADRNAIREIYSCTDDPDYRSSLDAIVYAALQKHLAAGKVETVTASIGPCTWTVTYNVPGIYIEGEVPSAD